MANKSRNKTKRQLAKGAIFVGENKRAALRPKGRVIAVRQKGVRAPYVWVKGNGRLG